MAGIILSCTFREFFTQVNPVFSYSTNIKFSSRETLLQLNGICTVHVEKSFLYTFWGTFCRAGVNCAWQVELKAREISKYIQCPMWRIFIFLFVIFVIYLVL